MKKIMIISLLCVFGVMKMQAEEVTHFVPERGDFSIGFDATPVFRFVGNIFNSSTNNTLNNLSGTPTINYGIFPNASIMAKYMISHNFALTANIGLTVNSFRDRRYVDDDRALTLDPLSGAQLIDVMIHRRSGMSFLLGGEYRLGDRRIQGIFGGGLLFAYGRDRTSFEWANQMTSINQNPTRSTFPNRTEGGYFVLERFTGSPTTYFGLVTHAGIEFFVAPRVSIGAQVNLAIYGQFGGQTYIKTERFIEATNRVETWTDLISPGNRRFLFGTDNLGGSLFVSFWF